MILNKVWKGSQKLGGDDVYSLYISFILHPKIKILSLIIHPHVVQTRKIFVHLRNTN